MTFADNKPIYRQIAERLEDEVVSRKYEEGERTPSVREYSALLQVNVNTVARAYETLAQDGVIQQQRGLGYYVNTGAREAIIARRRQHFINVEMPAFLRDMKRYGIPLEELKKCETEIEKAENKAIEIEEA